MSQPTGTKRILARTLTLDKVQIQDDFWSEYIRLVREVVVPYQWEALNDRVPEAEPSYAIRNFKIAAGEEQGEFGGMVFQDSDVAKWLEAVGYLLSTKQDADLEQVADRVVDLIAKAQHADGYINTYFTLKEPGRRWTNLAECHELYCAGHLIEAAVSYYQATGKRKLLDVVRKFADYIDLVFGSDPGKLKGYDGHQEIELALVKLFHATGEERYLQLSQFFLNERGALPHFYLEQFEQRNRGVHFPLLDISHEFSYSQSHQPIREQETAEGHAVRVVYMLSAMADVASETGDTELFLACKRLWRNIVSRRMYITGGIGSMAEGESFTMDYDLPSDTAYAETCASIGLIFFAHRMLKASPDSEYADVMERALYNTVVSGISRDGQHFFYVNPLEVQPNACGRNHIYDHIRAERQGWFGCACCPPNIARLLASLGQYIYTIHDRTLYTHLYIGGNCQWELDDGVIHIEQQSQYAWDGKVTMRVLLDRPTSFELALRIPNWSDRATIIINGATIAWDGERQVDKGYVKLSRVWADGDHISIVFSMPIRRMKGHPLIRDTVGKFALQRGPFVFCMEEADNGPQLHQLIVPKNSELETNYEPGLLGGMQVITAMATRMKASEWSNDLYREDRSDNGLIEQVKGKFIPYFAWANRGAGEMAVWIRDS